MSNDFEVNQILGQAKENEEQYNWLGAAELYTRASGLVPETDFFRRGGFQEKVGYAFYRAAIQAENADEFRERMPQAVANYEKAKEFYGRLGEARKKPRMLRCDAMIAYVGYWLTSEVPEKKRLINECWRLAKEALQAFDEAREPQEYGGTYNRLASCALSSYLFEWSLQACERILRDVVEYGERAITLLSGVNERCELARAYVNTVIDRESAAWAFISDLDEKERYLQKARDNWQKAIELSEEAALLQLLDAPGNYSMLWSVDEMVTIHGKALGCARKTKDRYLIGNALDVLAFDNSNKATETDDADKMREIYQRALQYAEEAKHQFSSISFVSLAEVSLFWGAEYYWTLTLWETDLRKRHELLEKALVDGTRGIKVAESMGYPSVVLSAHHTLSKVLGSLAQIEVNLEEKRKLLEEALEHRNEAIRITEQLYPFQYWNRGVYLNYLADLKAEMSNAEKDLDKRKSILEEAVSDKERCIQLCLKEMPYFEKAGNLFLFTALGYYQHSYGELLNRLYRLTSNSEHQRKAIKAFEEAAESFQKINMVTRVAECHWKAAQGHDAIGEHLEAAESFNVASSNYSRVAEKISQLKDFYQDHAVYMQAWSEIETARYHHERQEYGSAEEHYEKAATMHRSLKQWSYLAPNYSAWAQVEKAEDLSRKEQNEEANQAFSRAGELFTETKKSLQIQLSKIENEHEKQMATNLLKATDLRREYCTGRIALEEARILDKKGDHYSSSKKYGLAAETFKQITLALESEQDKKEFQLITTLSQAWQKMMLAEARASTQLYMEASQLFEQASEYSSGEETSFLTLGHSRFCRALEAGTKFADTRDATLYAAAVQYLESAANYYVKAGFQNASEYVKATELLLDAYVQMDNAKKELDPEKKAKLYTMAEKVLQTSAGSFMKAEHPEKREEVLRLLDKVKEERELAVSLAEVLHAPAIVSATSAFSTPNPTQENAVGLERFEHADIQANIIARQKELKVGESLRLEIELVNAGKGPALLTKITEIIPQGFELTEEPEMYRVEDSYLNMKGKRLDPLKMEEVKIVLKPKAQGVFPLKPTVMYLDENGKYRSHEPQAITITVKELGIKGWIKGEK